MRKVMTLTAASTPDGHGFTVASDSAGSTERAYFRTLDTTLIGRPESLIAAFLLKGMASGVDLRIRDPFSATFANGITTVQDIYTTWFPELSRVKVESDPIGSEETPDRRDIRGRVASFFTGGVDSFYTLLKHQDEIDTLVYVHGFDVSLENTTLRRQVSSMLRRVAESMDKRLIEVESDLPRLYRHRLTSKLPNWPVMHGAALAAVAHMLPDISRMYVPASYTYDHLNAWGSHPLLDPQWSSERLEVVHDGCEATRIQKCRMIAEHDVALSALRVCWENPNGSYNCGRCEKCQRTMINLLAVDALDRCKTFDRTLSPKTLSLLRIRSQGEAHFVAENLDRLRVTGKHPEVTSALERVLRRYRWMYRWLSGPRKLAKRLVEAHELP